MPFSLAHSTRFVYQLAQRWILPSQTKRPKLQVTLTCKCGTPQNPHSRNIPTHCVNPNCATVWKSGAAVWNPSEAEKVKYIETILALIDAAELNPDLLATALNDADIESARVKSPFAISIRLMKDE
jgi:hypothetical protein